jgi:hypothetical protein
MSMTKSGFAAIEPVSLDSLRSPHVPAFAPDPPTPPTPDADPTRDSIASAASFNDVALDDDEPNAPPSPNLLTATPSLQHPTATPVLETAVPHSTQSLHDPESPNGRPTSAGSHFSIALDDAPPGKHRHKKSASTTTLRSTHRASQDSVDLQNRRASVRASIEGTQKLQEEFARLQKEEQVHSNVNGHDASIDWGMSLNLPLISAFHK